jgi:hypothetical protein
MQNLFKPCIRLEEDDPTLVPGIPPGRDGPTPESTPRIPILQEANQRSGPRAPDHPHYMVVHHVGPGPFWALQESSRGLDPPACHDRQVHYVDQGEAPG